MDGWGSAFPSRVVLPLPRNPVTIVTGRLVDLPSTPLLLAARGDRPEQVGVEGIRRPAHQLRHGGPEGAKVLDQLRPPLTVTEDVLATSPVLDLEAVVAQDLV